MFNKIKNTATRQDREEKIEQQEQYESKFVREIIEAFNNVLELVD